MTATLFHNARLIDPATDADRPGELLVQDGLIAGMGETVDRADDVEKVDCQGHVLCPGLIDMMAFRYDAAAAAKGGITAIGLMPGQTPVLDNEAMITHAARRGPGQLKVYPIGAATRGLEGAQMAELGLMAQAGAVAFSDGLRAIADTGLMRQILSYAGHFKRPVLHHGEDPGLAARGLVHEGETATRLGLPGIPDVAEAMMVERDARLVQLTGQRLHLLTLATTAGIAALAMAQDRGLPLSAGTTPPYFTLNETAIEDYRTFTKLSPPLRPEVDRAAVVKAIGDGTLSILCSAHDPKDQESKRLPFSEAAFGAVGQETLLPVSLGLYHSGEVPLMTLLRAMTQAPAELLGLAGGRLAVGAPADLTIIDLDAPWMIRADQLISKAKNTPFDGLPVQGRAVRTVIDGQTVYREGQA